MARRRSPVVWPPLYRRRPVALSACAALLALAFVDRHKSDDYSRYDHVEFDVVGVVDGDTIDVDIPDGAKASTRIRLWGVDCPEQGTMLFGTEASDFTDAALASRRVRIVLSPTKARDIYGRLLAYVYPVPGEESLNQLLLTSGHAYADWRYTHPLKQKYAAIEKRAERLGVGLWSEVTEEDMPAWRQRMLQFRKEPRR